MIFRGLFDVFRPLVFMFVAAPKDPDFVDKYRKLNKKAEKFLATFEIDHKEAYLKAADKHLRDADGLIEYEKLDDASTQGKFADELANVYREKAAKYLKSGVKPDDEFGNELLLNAVYGTTKDQIKRAVIKNGKNYTAENHEKLSDKFMEQIKEKLTQIPAAHLNDTHIEDIVKYTKADTAAASVGYELNKPALTREEATKLLANYVAYGAIHKGVIEHIGAPYFRKKKK
ncbi:MAG: hypothetical protein AABX47_06275 [Nanoarchaeota archaeon]